MPSQQVLDAFYIVLLPAYQVLQQFAADPEKAIQHRQLQAGLEKAAKLLEAEYPRLAEVMRYGFAVAAVSGYLESQNMDVPSKEQEAVAPSADQAEFDRVRKAVDGVASNAAQAIGQLIPHAMASLRMAAVSPERRATPSVPRYHQHARADAAEQGELNYTDTREAFVRAAAFMDLVEPHIADYLRVRIAEFDNVVQSAMARATPSA